MKTNIDQNVGVDISTATLDVYLHPAAIACQFANDLRGIKALLGWLADRQIIRVVFEPTGRYHHGFERHLAAAGLSLAKVNPRQARRFAEAIGCNAKTDTVDAAMLARMGALLEPPSRPIPSEILDSMKELHVARLGLVKDRTAAKNRDAACRSPLLKRHAAQRLAQNRPSDRRHRRGSECWPDTGTKPQSSVRCPHIHTRHRRGNRVHHADRNA
jgi:transposase